MTEMGLRREGLASGSKAVGDALRVDALIDQYFDFVWRQLRRQGLEPADADDAAQEVFVIAARKIARITPERAQSFLYGTTLRVARNVRRTQRRRRETSAVDREVPALDASPDAAVEARRARALLAELLAELPEPLRRVLVLADVEELPDSAIAKLETIPLGTVASRLRRARQRFRELLAAATDRNPFGGAK